MDQLIDRLDAQLLERHRSNNELFEQLTGLQRVTGLLHGDRPLCPFLRPFFLPASRYKAISYAAKQLSRAFEKLTAAALDNAEIMNELGLTEKEEKWARLEPGYRCVSVNSRLDTFLTPKGFAFLEYNAENPAGIGDQTSLERLFQEVPEVREFLSENPHYFPQPHECLLAALDATYREFGGFKDKPAIAIVDWGGVATGSEFSILQEHFESRGYPAKICDPSELEFDGTALRHEDFAIDIFFKRVIIHEFLESFATEHPLYEAIDSGAVCMANSFRSKIPHKKSSFAILTDDKYHRLFSEDERTVIEQHIPWTRHFREGRTVLKGESIDAVEYIRREKHRFVLKPNDDYGGKGIAIGWECSTPEWDDAIENALSNKYIVQERVAVEKTDIPAFRDGELRRESMFVDFDPFLFRGEVEGGMVRLSDKSLINITQGGGETALVILEGY